MHSAKLLARMKAAGWTVLRTKGSHHQMGHPGHPGKVVTIPHPKKELGTGLVKAIMKQAGLE